MAGGAAADAVEGAVVDAVEDGGGSAAFASFSILEKSGALAGPVPALPDLPVLAPLDGAGAPAWRAGDGEEDLTCMAKRSRSLG